MSPIVFNKVISLGITLYIFIWKYDINFLIPVKKEKSYSIYRIYYYDNLFKKILNISKWAHQNNKYDILNMIFPSLLGLKNWYHIFIWIKHMVIPKEMILLKTIGGINDNLQKSIKNNLSNFSNLLLIGEKKIMSFGRKIYFH